MNVNDIEPGMMLGFYSNDRSREQCLILVMYVISIMGSRVYSYTINCIREHRWDFFDIETALDSRGWKVTILR